MYVQDKPWNGNEQVNSMFWVSLKISAKITHDEWDDDRVWFANLESGL